jgi:flagellar protein FliO/FliZ
MNRLITPSRAAPRAVLSVLGVAVGLAVLAHAHAAQAFTPSVKSGGEATPLDLVPSSSTAHSSSGGASIVRTIVGLLIVLAVIWGLTWVLKQVKSSREVRSAGSGLASLATLALGSGRTLHLVRAGRDYLLVGSAEHGVAPIHRYTETQAREAGLLDVDGGDEGSTGGGGGGGEASRRFVRELQIPGTGRPPATLDGASALLDRLREWTVRR